jgi:hypothetical protein
MRSAAFASTSAFFALFNQISFAQLLSSTWHDETMQFEQSSVAVPPAHVLLPHCGMQSSAHTQDTSSL